MHSDAIGPLVVWSDYAEAGWIPESVNTLEEALKIRKQRLVEGTSEVVITTGALPLGTE